MSLTRCLARPGIADDVKRRVVLAAEGNPLFVEQMLSMLTDQGALRVVNDRWVAGGDLSTIDIPPTIEALLAARLDGLTREERAVVQPAAVIGLTFPEPAVAALVPGELRPTVGEHIGNLSRKRLVQAAPPSPGSEAVLRFHHVLIRDAAYQRVLKRTRAKLHESFVAWADAYDADRGRQMESEGILGYHLEQAHRYLRELGPLDDHGRAVGSRASELLASAGRRAFTRGDMPAASSLLRRAAAVLEPATARRVTLLTDAGEALTEAGDLADADTVLESAMAEARTLGDAALETAARIVSLYLHYVTEGDRDGESIAEQVSQAMVVLEAGTDDRSLTRAWRILTNFHFAACRFLDAEEAAREMIAHARSAGDKAMEMRVLPALATCAEFGPTPVPEAIAVCEQVLADLAGDRAVRGIHAACHGHPGGDARQTSTRRAACIRAAGRRSRSSGWKHGAAMTAAVASGPVELWPATPWRPRPSFAATTKRSMRWASGTTSRPPRRSLRRPSISSAASTRRVTSPM